MSNQLNKKSVARNYAFLAIMLGSMIIGSLVGWFFFHQKLDLPAMIGLGLIVAGVAVMHLFSKSMEL